ncbi:MAG: HD domain-containing protein [Candidatus Woesearchaeota archaeon]
MSDIQKFRTINQLKRVQRLNSVDTRKESPAEHTWSCLLLADYFLSHYDLGLDRLKVYELLMYHDVIEIESGDYPLHPDFGTFGKEKSEQDAKNHLSQFLPISLNNKFVNLFDEFESQKTAEARFAKAIDALDPMIHEMDYKDDWKGWSESFLRSKKEKYFQEFPPLQSAFEQVLAFLKENGYVE